MNNGRSVGVHVPKSQGQETSDRPAGTIVGFTPLQFIGVDYVNQKGRIESGLFVVTSEGSVAVAPNGSQWVADMKTITNTELGKSILALLPKQTARDETTPPDQLDVMGG